MAEAVTRLDPPDLWRFSVASRSSRGVRYEVVIEPQQPDDPFLCTCPRFTKNTHHHGQACHHIRQAARWLQRKTRPPRERGPGQSINTKQ